MQEMLLRDSAWRWFPTQADINKQLGDVETILLFSDPRYSSISSTLVRELRFFGREVDEFLPKAKV